MSEIEERKKEQRSLEEEINLGIEELREKIKPAEEELARLEKASLSSQKAYSVAQQSVTVAERYQVQAQSELTRKREALESLRKRIEDDFGLVDFEYANKISGPTPLPFGDLVQQLPMVEKLSSDVEETINYQRSQLRRMGAINPEAQNEYKEVQERFEFLTTQMNDLKAANSDLQKVIAELDELMKIEFRETFDAVAEEFKHMFTRLFGGGAASLVLLDDDNPTRIWY